MRVTSVDHRSRDRHGGRGAARDRVSWYTLYAEPVACIVAVVSVVLVFAIAANTRRPADFNVFWDSARWYRLGLDPYTGGPPRLGSGYNLNAPAALLVFLPFSFLPIVPAFLAWTALEVVAYVIAAHWIARAIAPGRTLAIAAAVLASQATFSALHLGQPTALLMLTITAAWLADRDDRPWRAGLLLGVAIAFKLWLAVFLGYALWRRSRPFLVRLFAGIGVVTLAGFVVAGSSGYRSWIGVLRAVTWTPHLSNASLLGLITRELTVLPDWIVGFTPIAHRPEWVRPIWIAAVAVVVAVAAHAGWRMRDRDRAWAITLLAGILISPLGWVYYAPLLTGPLLALGLRSSRDTRAWLVAGYICFLVPYGVIARPLGPLNTLVFAAVYTWGFVLWFVAAVWPADNASLGLQDGRYNRDETRR